MGRSAKSGVLPDMPRRARKFLLALAAGLAFAPGTANAHPHVFVEANLEIVRDDEGAVTTLRHVWRFDELFSSTVLLDFDADADGKLDQDELEEVSKTVTQSIGEQDWFTEVRLGKDSLAITGPEKILVDYADGQVLMFFEAKLDGAVQIADRKFRVSVADPTYYVAMEIASEAAVQIRGYAEQCNIEIYRPDYEALYAKSSATLTEEFFQQPDNPGMDDEWFTWIDMTCGQ